MKNRNQIIAAAVHVRAEIEQIFNDADHWNTSVRKLGESAINPDPDGQLAAIRRGIDKMLHEEKLNAWVTEAVDWQCSCGERCNPSSSKWRWSGQDWEHHHAYPVGHVTAMRSPEMIGVTRWQYEDGAVLILAGTADQTRAEAQAHFAGDESAGLSFTEDTMPAREFENLPEFEG